VLLEVNIFHFVVLEFFTNIEIEVFQILSSAGFQSELIVEPLELLLLTCFGFKSIVSPELDRSFFFLVCFQG